jgi:DNA-binding response OmpR family regulator
VKGFNVTQCLTGTEAVTVALNVRFDLIVLDLMLPGVDGTEVARRVRRTSDVPIIMVTARDAEADRILGFDVGADDYVVKPFSVRELEARIRAILRRTAKVDRHAEGGTTIVHAGIELDAGRRRAIKNGKEIPLTRAQFEILSALLASPGRVMPRADLVERIGGYAYDGYERTIDVHIKNIRKAIETDPGKPEIILTVWGIGYKAGE